MNSHAGNSVRVTTYLRVSSFGQTQKEFGSLDKQLENAKMMVAHYAEKNWNLVSEFRDPGITGTDDNRPGLAALMAAAERHEFDVVIFQFLDRLSRHASYTLRLLERLQELGIEVYDSDGLRIDITTPEGLIRAGIGALFAQAAHQKMVKATRKGVTTKASKGYSSGGMAGYGYDRIEDTKIGVVPNPVQAPIMQEAYRRLAEGEDLSEVVSDFRARGVRTKPRVFKGKGGERTVGNMLFTTDQLERMIRNSLYRGKVRCRYDDDAASNISIQKPLEMDRYEKGYAIYQGQFKALVSDELWWQANHALDKRTKRKLPSRPVDPAGRFLLQGRFKCGCCKCQMATTHTRGRSGAKFYYYKCRHHIEDGDRAKCSVRALPITLVHGTVMRFLTRVIMQPEIIAATLEGVKSQTRDDKGRHHRELKEVNGQLAGIRGEISQCVDAVTKQLVPALLPDLRKRASELKEREQALLQKHWELAARCNAEFAGYPNEADVMATLNDFVTKVEYLSSPQQKELV
ncbi:MAG: recombinase family protein [Opitutaceae bacterium]